MEENELGNRLYTSSLFFLGILTLAALFVAAFDIIRQTSFKTCPWPYLGFVIGIYISIAFFAIIIGFYRINYLKKANSTIPKSSLPINAKDLPKSVHSFITSELTRVSKIAFEAEPRVEDGGQPGWGRPDSSLADIHFKTSISQTPDIIEQAAIQRSSLLRRQHSISIQRYIDFLIEHNMIDRRIGHLYIEGYERARFSDDEFSEQQYTEFMKLVTVLLRMIESG
ncbi:hypothetical protein G9A89_011690 [Geosiphon pyriformis]|nr:hypothetical protein G9A89_011690 [Geosiphon pyriformis]